MFRYIINFFNFAKQILPPFLRKTRQLDWLRALLKPLQNLHTAMHNFMRGIRYRIGFNGQVIYLEHILNDYHDDILRRIFIADGNVLGLPLYVYNKLEARPKFIRNKSEAAALVYLRNRSEYNSSSDFDVNVPSVILTPELAQQIRALIMQYRIAGKRFRVVPF